MDLSGLLQKVYLMSSINTEIIIGFLSVFGTLIGTAGGIIASSKLTLYRIEQLEKKVEKHNEILENLILSQRDVSRFLKNKTNTYISTQ
ncbi:hypothetical protein SDC9_128669 [bioreactor metagenome]|uniref:Uncharacterized protein n=1 Tax=bioreactor metagenome TaxID=1076179 RepID=A0A645CXL2_9ZZZZ